MLGAQLVEEGLRLRHSATYRKHCINDFIHAYSIGEHYFISPQKHQEHEMLPILAHINHVLERKGERQRRQTDHSILYVTSRCIPLSVEFRQSCNFVIPKLVLKLLPL